MTDPLDQLLARLPEGASEALLEGRRWATTKVTAAGGRAVRLYAEELGGTTYVSANAYVVGGQWQLKPCEMPEERVLTFLRGFSTDRPDAPSSDGAGTRPPCTPPTPTRSDGRG